MFRSYCLALRKVTFNNLKKLKHGILLNENASRFMSNTRDYVVIPGGVNEKEGEHEYQEIKEKRIIYAGALTKYSGVRNLVEAIRQIDEFECTKSGKCIAAREEEAIIQTDGRLPKLPTRLTKVGKFKKR